MLGKVVGVLVGIFAIGGGYKLLDLTTVKNLEYTLYWEGHETLNTEAEPRLLHKEEWEKIIAKYWKTDASLRPDVNFVGTEEESTTNLSTNKAALQKYCRGLLDTLIPDDKADQSVKASWKGKLQKGRDWCTVHASQHSVEDKNKTVYQLT